MATQAKSNEGLNAAFSPVVPIPNLIEIQLNSFKWFLEDGLRELFRNFSPIRDFTETLELELVDYHLEQPKYSQEECRQRDMTFEAPIKVKVRLHSKKEDGPSDVMESEVYMGALPLMTEKGTFIINGAERVVVSQLARSPGVYFRDNIDYSGRTLYYATVIPSEGAWTDVETETSDAITVRVGQTKKFPITTLLRALSYLPEANVTGTTERRWEEGLGWNAAEKVVDPETGEVVLGQGEAITPEVLEKILGVELVTVDKLKDRWLVDRLVDAETGEVVWEPGSKINAPALRKIKAATIASAEVPQPERTEVALADAKGRVLKEDIVDPGTGEVLLEAGKKLTAADTKRISKAIPDLETVSVEPDAVAADSNAILVKVYGRKPRYNVGATVKVFQPLPRTATNEDILRFFGTVETYAEPSPEDLVGKYPTTDLKGPDNKLAAPAFKRMDVRQAEQVAAANKPVEVISVSKFIGATLDMDATKDENTALLDIYRKVRPGDPATLESARNLLRNIYYDVRRYDLARVGRYKLNRKLGQTQDPNVSALTRLDIVNIIRYIEKLAEGDPTARVDDIDHLENKRVRSVGELLQNQLRLGFLRMEKVARERMTSVDAEHAIPQVILSVKPISASIKSFFGSSQLSQFMDQHNPLAELTHKRRLSALGPGGLSRQSAKLEVRDVHHSHYGRICPIETPEGPNIGLIGSMAVYTRINQFGFLETPYYIVYRGTIYPEVVYLTADEEEDGIRAWDKVRPVLAGIIGEDNIEDPSQDELAQGVHLAPSGTQIKDNGNGTYSFVNDSVQVRRVGRFPIVDPTELPFMLLDISPMQVFSPATSLIPFLENDDANRALMGSNMQRQAVPVIKTQAPIVGTGLEGRVAIDSGAVVTALRAGRVTSVTSERILVETFEKDEDGKPFVDEYRLENMRRSNQATCVRQVAVVHNGQRVRQGQVLADGPCTDHGRLALGQNLLVAFMPWGGYNYEDAIILSERVVKDDVFTSIHIEKYEVEARDTKLGPEEITRDIPNVSEDTLKDLDEYGIIRVGAEVGPEDILVGKVAPKSQGEQSAEERLIIAIFGKKAEETRDVSLRVPHGEKGKIIDVKVFSRFKFECERCHSIYDFSKKPDRLFCDRCGGDLERLQGDELPAGVNQLVRVYIAQKRRIMEGDKMAGRHGNKGVISRILPVEEMPFLPDGTPVDIVLNPLGVPSRMNIGQVMETHLGFVGRVLGKRYDENIFRGRREEDILEEIKVLVEHFRKARLEEYVTGELGLALDLPEDAKADDVVAATREAVAALTDEERAALAERLGVGSIQPVAPLVEQADSSVTINLAPPTLFDPDYVATVDDIVERIEANVARRVGMNRKSGKCLLIDGQTGEPFDNESMVGQIYMMKLLHLVEDKIHARSTGPYSLVTQQPLGGKAQFGGQRFGEMEVWALEAYGAAHTLQEILTIKSDDVLGRVKTYEAIVKGDTIQEPGIPESFKILVNELQSLCLRVAVEDEAGHEIDLRLQEDEQFEAAERSGAPRLAQARYEG
jgi:DNA-directed RNA polymerase subunit beta